MRLSKGIVLMCLLASPCLAQKESLLIGPGDLVHVQVFETPELEQHIRVTDAGKIKLLAGDDVTVTGLTPNEAARTIEKDMIDGHWMLAPHVIVTVEQYTTENVTILGQVHSPGSYAIETPRRVYDVLALAGGLNDLADHTVTIERHGTKEKIPYIVSNNADTALDSAPMIYPGDAIIVPKADIVYVLGDVGRPGGYVKSTNDGQLTVLRVISLAGSTPPNAVPSKARIIRKQADGSYVELPLPLADMQKGKQPDMPLEANDVIYVPFSYVRNIAVNLGGLIASTSSAAIYVAK
jgi:polysaccharide export outer membrane protein